MTTYLKYILILIVTFSSQYLVANEANKKEVKKAFSYLDIDCKRKSPSAAMQAYAGSMTVKTLKMIQTLRKKRKAEGKDLKALLLARGKSSLSTKATLISNEPSYKEIKTHINQWLDKNLNKEDFVTTGSHHRNQRYERLKDKLKEDILLKKFKEQDPDKTLDFTHIGILVKDSRPEALLGWSIIHVLSPCSSNVSRVYNEGIAKFFLDEPDENQYMAWAMVPDDDIQTAIIDILEKNKIHGTDKEGKATIDWSLKPPIYNLIASMDRPEEGNSNAFPLYVLSAAIANEKTADYIRANTLSHKLGYQPSRILIDGLYKMIINPGPFRGFIPDAVNFRKEDHPFTSYLPVVEVNSAQSIRDFMFDNKVLDEEYKYAL